jgi:Zn-dependent protease with chaperone function
MDQHVIGMPPVPLAMPAPIAQTCPLCGTSIIPDALGLVECSCGWGGPGDPIVSARGLSRLVTRTDRRLANRMGHADLRRLAKHATGEISLGAGYITLLVAASTAIYLAIGALLVGGAVLAATLARDGVWLGFAICVVVVLVTFFALVEFQPRPRGVEAPRVRFPALAAALDEVSQRIGAPVPHRVVLVPQAQAFVYQRHPLRRLFRRERVLCIGAGALPLLSDADLKAILAHELAHYRHGHTALHLYTRRAEHALHNFITIIRDAVTVQRQGTQSVRMRSSGMFFVYVASLLVWIVTLPMGLLLVVFHLLHLAESRTAEFEADRTAMRAYGPQALMNGLTGLIVAAHTMRGARGALRAEMMKHNSANFYDELRRHYAELPTAVIAKLRMDALCEFRSLEHTHPTTPDRLRAALFVREMPPPAPVPPRPAVELLIPAGALNADDVETELTKLLFADTPLRSRR